ncbi:Mannosyl-oligosaccharide 1,2-alpha-mannosidase IC [Liparis tanakae]|uniref:Mannosyl-oligosaccharide 1,2-alpha-mannosidase IC n=1 Tax=Liparis tanakae TaxID=230148 RepID=A0A4Z2HPA8_9TELE|nr:Mannosyl-oligosaccharide 1,2-alpha-mannosidase IC [Liparis tanakae]
MVEVMVEVLVEVMVEVMVEVVVEVVVMMKFSWDNYKRYAWGKNELRPLTRNGHIGNMFGGRPRKEEVNIARIQAYGKDLSSIRLHKQIQESVGKGSKVILGHLSTVGAFGAIPKRERWRLERTGVGVANSPVIRVEPKGYANGSYHPVTSE